MNFIQPLVGGVLIGVAASLMLLLNGRVTGISGIISGALTPKTKDVLWRVTFILGLFAGGVVLKFWSPEVFPPVESVSYVKIILAGLLVGFGTLLGNGCTSGHGVCGISRLSLRSLVATVVFMSAGIIVVFIMRMAGV